MEELDAEPVRALGQHLDACPACRQAWASLRAAAEALRAAVPLAGSSGRREAAAGAMERAWAEESERRLLRGGSRAGGAWRLAAAVIMVVAAAGAAYSLWASLGGTSGGAVAFVAAEVASRADVFRAAEGRWYSLAAGDRVRWGDRVVTQPAADPRLQGPAVRFDIVAGRSAGALGRLALDADSSLALVSPCRVALDRGRLFLELREPFNEGIVVTDTANNGVSVRKGRVEVGLREVRAMVAAARESRDGGGMALPDARSDLARRLAARVSEGEARLRGSHGQCLVVGEGQEGGFDIGGKPETRAAAPPAGPAWWGSR